MIRQRPVGRLLSRYLSSCEVEVEKKNMLVTPQVCRLN